MQDNWEISTCKPIFDVDIPVWAFFFLNNN